MGNVVKFQAQGKEYPLSIIERESERLISLQQVGEAMGNKQPRRTLHDLKQSKEIIEEKHCRSLSELQPGDTQARTRVYLTGTGCMRFAMRSQGRRAREFRDWAEVVLFEVMMTGSYFSEDMQMAKITHQGKNPVFNHDAVWFFHDAFQHKDRDLEALDKIEDALCQFGMTTGSYQVDRALPAALETARCEGFNQGLALTKVSSRYAIPIEILAKIVRYRKLSMTQTEVGAAFGFSKWRIQRMEADLRNAGIIIPAVRVAKRDKELLADLGGILASNAGSPGLSRREATQ